MNNILALFPDVVVKTKIEHDKAAVANPRVNETYFQYETSLKIDEYKYCTNVAVTIPEVKGRQQIINLGHKIIFRL